MEHTGSGSSLYVYPDGRVDALNAARFLGCSAKTLAHMRCNGRGPAFIKRGRIYYYITDLQEWLNQAGRHRSTAQARLATLNPQPRCALQKESGGTAMARGGR